jgi:hypothetical protein
MRYDEAKKRNALPVPADQYGNPGSGGVYDYWDQIDLNALAPTGAASAEIALLYQGTSWEYIQFLDRANNGQNAFLGQEGKNMLEAWINAEVPVAMVVGDDRRMAPPVLMASASWGAPPTGNTPPTCTIDTPSGDVTIGEGDSVTYAGTATDSDGTIAGYAWNLPGGSPVSSTAEDPDSVTYDTAGVYTASFTATDDAGASCAPATIQVTVTAVGGGPETGVTGMETGYYSGKGKNQAFTAVDTFVQGDTVIIRSTVLDSDGQPVSGATVTTDISRPAGVTLTATSDASGVAEASWNTQAPNKRGQGGTATGSYTATTSDVTADGYAWDGVPTSATFTLQ